MTDTATRSVAALALRRTWKGALAIALADVLVTVTAVQGYVAAYPDPADRVTLAESIGANPGLIALFGQTRALETVAGFTEWRVVLILAVVGAVWGLLAATRVLRGEEESGRAELLLAGRLTRPGAAVAALVGVGGSLLLMLSVTTIGMVAGAGGELGAGRAALLALTIVGTAAAMVGAGALTSQLAETRRRASGLAAAVLAASYLVRVVADSAADLNWLLWLTPLGWLELAHPLTGPALAPIVLPYLLGLALCALAVALVRVRDTGAGILSGSGGRRAVLVGLGSPVGLAGRLGSGPALAWAVGLGIFGMLIGLIARTAAEAMADSRGDELLGQLGIGDSGTRAYVGVAFVFLTLALTTAAAGQVSATREEEASGRLDTLLMLPVGRGRWLAGRLAVALGLLVLGAGAATAGTWLAGRISGLGVASGDLVAAGANVLPAAVFVLGVGTLLHGVVPRLAIPLTYALVAGSFLLEVVGSTIELPEAVLTLSVLHHVAPAPAVAPDWTSAGVLIGLGALLAALGILGLRGRDVEPA